MSDLYWLTNEQMAKLAPFFPKSHGKPRVDDRRVLSGIIFINRNGLRWRDAPEAYGPQKTLYSRWKRWGEKGIFARMMAGLAAEHGEQKTLMIDACDPTLDVCPGTRCGSRGRLRRAVSDSGWPSTFAHRSRYVPPLLKRICVCFQSVSADCKSVYTGSIPVLASI
ncbi:transposase [Rhodovulum sulfidophilum]|uniref:Transposase n=1 Tax=Rhodovulum sulfidophilum TaxID=35806 RepID=A0A0D6AYF3_RHOSU|nr:transposase [Rhodovulum sulfidophilum]